MILNKLVVIPTAATLVYLGRIFGACPFDLDLNAVCVEINTSENPMVAMPGVTYKAQVVKLGVFYDAATAQSSLILGLGSQALAQRYLDLQESAPHAYHTMEYYPHSVLVSAFPASRRYKSFINSVESTFLAEGAEPLYFDGEMVIPTEVHIVPDSNYYETMAQIMPYQDSLAQLGLRSI